MSYIRTLGIDPGRDAGWAVYDGESISCGLVHVFDVHGRGKERVAVHTPTEDPDLVTAAKKKPWPKRRSQPFSLVAVELPTIYPHGKGDPNDLIRLAVQVGEITNDLRRSLGVLRRYVRLVEPRTWKGSRPKEVHHRQLRKQLGGELCGVVDAQLKGVAKSFKHNIWDAVGLALWAYRVAEIDDAYPET